MNPLEHLFMNSRSGLRMSLDAALRPAVPISSAGLYDAYVAWRDCKEGDVCWDSKTHSGLCGWLRKRWAFEGFGNHLAEMQAQLAASLRNGPSPFNTQHPLIGDSGYEAYMSYSTESTQERCPLNPARIQWVNDRIADYEKHHGLS